MGERYQNKKMGRMTSRYIQVLYVVIVVGTAAGCDPCSSSRDCVCPSVNAPGNLTVNQTPQFVLVSFDDAITQANINFYRRLFHPSRTNSNGCPISGTFFVADNGGTDYSLVKELYQKGHAIGSHSQSHRFPQSWWQTASETQLVQEFVGQRSKTASLAQIPESEIKSTRVPFLSLGGNRMYNVFKSNGFQYDTSFSMGPFSPTKNETLYFPFTLDSPVDQSTCTLSVCPTGKFPGLWEIPLVRLYGNQNDVCAMTDGCKTTSAQDVHSYLKNNFMRYYKTNRAPFGVHLHATWFRTLYNLEGMDSFIKELVAMPNVWFINMNQMIEWMKQPESLDKIAQSTPWTSTGCQITQTPAPTDEVATTEAATTLDSTVSMETTTHSSSTTVTTTKLPEVIWLSKWTTGWTTTLRQAGVGRVYDKEKVVTKYRLEFLCQVDKISFYNVLSSSEISKGIYDVTRSDKQRLNDLYIDFAVNFKGLNGNPICTGGATDGYTNVNVLIVSSV